MITIVDYKTGNLGSIKNMLKRIGEPSTITGDVDEIRKSSKIILSGVGSFDAGVQKLRDSGIWDVLNDKILVGKTPILGICLGAQLMTQGSEEGKMAGFGWVDAKTVKFRIDQESKLKVPSMGWNSIMKEKDSLLFKEIVDNPRFYFVHSFHFEFEDKSQELSTSEYSYTFCSAFEKENVIGVQFHPEKSHRFGMNLLKNFVLNY
jgi:glutamine amidotransferase